MPLPSRAPKPLSLPKMPRIAYHMGLTEVLDGKRYVKSFAGFVVEAGNPDVDAILEGTPKATLRHPRSDAKSPYEIKEYWNLGPDIGVFPIFSGMAGTTIYDLVKHQAEQANMGIAVTWPRRTDGTKSKSSVSLLVFYPGPHGLLLAELSAKGLMSEYMIDALLTHLDVCEALDNIINREQHPDPVFPGEVKLPLHVSETEVAFGKNAGKTSVYPMEHTHITDPDKLKDKKYIAKIWAPAAFTSEIEAQWETAIAWAKNRLASANREAIGSGPIAPVETTYEGEYEEDPYNS